MRRITGTTPIRLALWIALALLWCARDARAQAGWSGPPRAISAVSGTLRSINPPDIAADPAGNAVAVWMEMDAGFRGHVFAARFDAAAGHWSPPRRLSDGLSTSVLEQRVAMDGAGNALVLWSQTAPGVDWTIHSARYSAATATWSAPDVRSTGSASGVRLAMNAAGDAVAIWSVFGTFAPGPVPGVYATRYAAGSGTWTTPERLGPTVQTGLQGLDIAIDGAGNAVAVWHYSAVEARRLTAATGQWGTTAVLSAPLSMPQIGQLLPVPKVAVNGAGDAVANWTNGGVVEAARYRHASDTWTPAARVSTGSDDSQRGAIDSAGNIVLAWHHNTATTRTLQATRFDAAASAWTAVRDLAPPGAPIPLIFNYGPPAVVVDAADNVLVLASRSVNGTDSGLVSSYFARGTGTWFTGGGLSLPGRDARLPNLAADGAGSVTAVWFEGLGSTSTNQAMRWHSTPGAPVVTGVQALPGSVSAAFMQAAVLDPALAPTTIEYSLDNGATWSPRLPASATAPLTLIGLADGTPYSLRLRAVNAAGHGVASAPLVVTSGASGQPQHLRVVARVGNRLTLAWTAPPAGLVPTSYELEGGIGGVVLARVPTGGAATQITLTVPDGTLFVRVVAVAGSARSAPSNEIVVAMNTSNAPASPNYLLGSASGDRVALSWTNALTGAVPTSLVLNVTGAITTALALPVSESFTFAGVPPGTYTFTVRAMNGALGGATGNAVTLTFLGACAAAPNPPTAFSVSTQGGQILLDWLPPASGEAVTHYIVSASGAFTGSFPMTARTFSAPVPPGSYTIRVAAVGPCGTSASTPPQTADVP